VLLHNGGFCNGCITQNGFISKKLFLRKKIKIIQEMRNYIRFFRYFHLSVFFHQRAVVKQDHCMDTIVEFGTLRFLMQPLQNLLLCSSTTRATMDDIPFAILNSSNFISYSPPPVCPSLPATSWVRRRSVQSSCSWPLWLSRRQRGLLQIYRAASSNKFIFLYDFSLLA
jgi:hypothetical protein